MDYELITINGSKLLGPAAAAGLNQLPTIRVNADTIVRREWYPCSAFLDQLREELSQGKDSADMFLKNWVYVDFSDDFRLKRVNRRNFDRLFTRGFNLVFENSEPIHFVPLLSSSSQSKKFIYGFIRADLFEKMRSRLDLDIPFEERIEERTVPFISKLYSYRGLYSSGTTPILRACDEGGEEFFDEKNIIVLNEFGEKQTVWVYTTTQKAPCQDGTQNEVEFEQPVATRKEIGTSFFDGEGIISPAGQEKLNSLLPSKMRGSSFQVRMPYFKGMLHTVDFHKFLRDQGVQGDCALIRDVFGVERNLFEANVIVTTTVFKMWSLISGSVKKDKERRKKIITDYFTAMRRYNHGLYLVTTEASFHNTQTTTLSSQMLSTLKLSAEDLDGLVSDHRKKADAYCASNLLCPESRQKLFAIADRDDWMELLLCEPAFLRDVSIQQKLENHRISRYHDIASGNIRIDGENRFLSGDLYYFLVCLLKLVSDSQPHLKDQVNGLEANCIQKGCVYIPRKANDLTSVALLRSPHLSRNEDVCANVVEKSLQDRYDVYLGKLSGVVFVGHDSHIHAALGGADFDGDQIVIAYDKRIINACKHGYVETKDGENSPLPFVCIPSLDAKGAAVKSSPYIVPQVVYNSFSNRIGKISNAAMKIAAIEYDETLPKLTSVPPAAFCTILTGTEIDACKKGLRPNIDGVVGYKGKENEDYRKIVGYVQEFIDSKETLKERGRGYKLKVGYNKQGQLIIKEKLDINISPNREHNAVTQLLYRWAKAFDGFSESQAPTFPDSLKSLQEIFPEENLKPSETNSILTAFSSALSQYRVRKKERDKMYAKRKIGDDKIYIRLKGQYDDIYNLGKASYQNRMNCLRENIWAVCEKYEKAQIKALRTALFGEGEKFCAYTYWPYGKALEDNALYREIAVLEDFELLCNFDFEGYRLLNYILYSAPCKEDVNFSFTNQQSDCPYLNAYRQYAESCFASNVNITDFEAGLAKMARADIEKALGCASKTDIIRSIYPPKSEQRLKAFWKLYSVGDVLAALRGDGDA